MRKIFFVYILLMAILPLAAVAQSSKQVPLENEPVSYIPKDFYISQVVDDRNNGDSVGNMTSEGSKDRIVLEGGSVRYLEHVANGSAPRSKDAQGVELHLTKINTEIKRADGLWDINVSITFAYCIGPRKLIEYSSKGHAQMSTDPLEYAGHFIRQSLGNNMKKFDEWWPQNRGTVATAAAVKVTVTMGKPVNHPDWIPYTPGKLLKIADFMAPEKKEVPEMAETASGIGLSYTTRTENGQTVVNITVVSYFDKSQSWFKQVAKNSRVLEHEQTHFDITAAIACDLITALRGATYTSSNYTALIKELQDASTKARAEEQDRYDMETNHGIIRDKQDAWDARVKEKLSKGGCY